jgi:hypothetical protein
LAMNLEFNKYIFKQWYNEKKIVFLFFIPCSMNFDFVFQNMCGIEVFITLKY